ncbi:sodium ion-translocating decarboxylase subunit beta [Labilibacter marinus]|uniref:sodium ion-translocating decarboxylase subunit beta n=1 Tax=Labilibacter marinus TaxID=1477105 RepID=UPI00094F4DFF|nr:sodium ion-translocating decarboxylase subunit beta [Labilibacter marinus]
MKKHITTFITLTFLLCLQVVFGTDIMAAPEAVGAMDGLTTLWNFTGFANIDYFNLIMISVGLFFIFLAVKYDYEPLLLIPIGTGIILGNIPGAEAYGVYAKDYLTSLVASGQLDAGQATPSVLEYLYFGVQQGIYPPLIFLGIGAMTDFSSLISNPKLMILGAAAQIGIFATFLGASALGFTPQEAGAIGIIGGADGPTAIFLSSKLAPHLMGAIAIAAYSYMALVPVIQPPIMRLIIPKKERAIKMKPPRAVSKTEKIMFPLIALLLTTFISPSALPLLGMLFFGNLLKESGVTERLADTARNSLINIITILLGITVGASTQASVFLTTDSLKIFGLGALSFIVATAGGLLFARFLNVFLHKNNKINPLIGAAGVSAVPDSARVVQQEGLKTDPNNHLLMHAMAPNVSGVIGSAVAAGIMLSFLL